MGRLLPCTYEIVFTGPAGRFHIGAAVGKPVLDVWHLMVSA